MSSRFFLTTFLPTLSFEKPAELSFDELFFYLRLNLSAREMKELNSLRTFYDIENACSYLSGNPMHEEGSLSHEEIRALIEEEELTLPGARTFFSTYPTHETRKKQSCSLLRFFLQETPHHYPSFVKKYFAFEHTSKILTSYLRAKALGTPQENIKTSLEFDLTDTRTWPEVFLPLEKCLNNTTAYDVAESISRWKFQSIDVLCEKSPPFSLDLIFTYLIKLRIIENRQELLDPTHINILERIKQ